MSTGSGAVGATPRSGSLAMDRIEAVFDTQGVTIALEYRLKCDRCHRTYPKRSADEIHLAELARKDGWVRAGKA